MKKRITVPRLVADHRCTECLYTSARVVSAERAAEIIRKCRKQRRHFLCHKGSIIGIDIICHGSYIGENTEIQRRIANMAGWVQFVDPEHLEKDKKAR